MDQDEQLLYEAFTNYANDSLFWSLIFLNNAVFGTAFLEDSRQKLMSLGQMYETIMLSVYPAGQCSGLIEAMKGRSGCFVHYVDCLLEDSPETETALEQWRQNGQSIALMRRSSWRPLR